MGQADRIRAFVVETIIIPARTRNLPEIEIRAGDIHSGMHLANAMPAVCSAIGSRKFETYAGVTTIARTGPSQGSNARFRFAINASSLSAVAEQRVAVVAKSPPPERETDFTDAVALVSCVKSKRERESAARDLYTSTWFAGVRGIAERHRKGWYILSALYGLVEPRSVIAPYDFTLNRCGVAERRGWADRVFDALVRAEPDLRRVVIFAGLRYREFLVPKLAAAGITVEVPMEHLRRGEQLAWLAGRS